MTSTQDRLDLPFGSGVESEAGNRYLILDFLGRGGNAEAYRSVAILGPHRGLFFALKVFYRISRPAWRKNFLDEARFLKECNHPAVMRVFDQGEVRDGHHPFIVMEYLPQTLDRVLTSKASIVERLGYALRASAH